MWKSSKTWVGWVFWSKREGTLEWLKNKNIVSVDGVHHTPPPDMYVSDCQRRRFWRRVRISGRAGTKGVGFERQKYDGMSIL
jgi:hypothetical protein